MKKTVKIIIGVVAALIVAIIVAVACLWGGEIASIKTIKMVDGNQYLYQMEYKADYDLDAIIAANIDDNGKLLNYVVDKIGKGLIHPAAKAPGADFACTSFQAMKSDSTGFFFGRNYDYFKDPSLVTISRPKKGYSSISVSDMSHFGYNLEKLPTSLKNKLLCLASVYAPVDGMNEKGLCTSIMTIPGQASEQNTGKNVVGTTIIMRLWLDRCATVDEAIALVNSLDVRHDKVSGSGYHYFVADANGDCAVIEFDKWDDWKTVIIRKEEGKNWMHVTNHLLNPKYYCTEPNPEYGNPNSHSWWRYETVANYLGEKNGVVSLEEAQECLSQVHWVNLVWENGIVEDTQYSNVYDQKELKLHMRPWNDYDKTYTFSLK